MKNLLRYVAPVLGLAAGLPAVWAADGSNPSADTPKKQMRVIASSDSAAPNGAHTTIIRRLGESGEKEVVTFLGVETTPVSPTLTAQLGLADGTGLVVNHVVPDSPAGGALKQHDILLKLDDQILIEQRQLAVLIRGHKEGDEITLTYLRAGKQATAKVKLAKHEVPKLALSGSPAAGSVFFSTSGSGGGAFGGGPGPGPFDVLVNPDSAQSREIYQKVLPLLDGAAAGTPGIRRYGVTKSINPGDRNISVTVNTGNSHLVLNDDKGSLDLTIKEGSKNLVAKNAKGEQVFSGPVNTPEERKALPDDVRARLGKLEDSTQFNFTPDGDFKAEGAILRPHATGIATPLSPPAADRPPLSF